MCCILVSLSVGGFERAEDQISLSQAELTKHHGISNMHWVVSRENQTIFCTTKGYFKASNKYPLRLSWFFLQNMKTSLATKYQQLILPKE